MREKDESQEMSARGGVRTPPSPSSQALSPSSQPLTPSSQPLTPSSQPLTPSPSQPRPQQPLAPWLRALRALSTLLAMLANIGRARKRGTKSAAFDAAAHSGPSCSARSRNAQALCSLRSDCRALAGSNGGASGGEAAESGRHIEAREQSGGEAAESGRHIEQREPASGRAIDLLVLHCSDTRPSQRYTLEMLRRDHARRGFGQWPGYHLYLRRDGALHYCRPVSERGCHVSGYNAHSIGICYEGGHSDSPDHRYEDNRTAEQLVVIDEVLKLLREYWPEARIVGHRDLCGGRKACPCFDAQEEYGYLQNQAETS